MIDPARIFMLAALIGAVGLWLMLPRGQLHGRLVGVVLGAVSLGLLASQLPSLGGWIDQSVFAVLAFVTVASAAAAVTLRNPVYCAIWFGMSLVGTAGLFFFQGAQFLAVATIIVYAGAILVTFLFVLMLAEPSGRAMYDRKSWEALVSSFGGAFLIGILSLTAARVLANPEGLEKPVAVTQQEPAQAAADQHTDQYMARIGNTLFDRYLIAVEVAGVLLLAALIGAAVIVGHARGPLAGPRIAPQGPEEMGGPAHG